jgi:hypothetical protein
LKDQSELLFESKQKPGVLQSNPTTYLMTYTAPFEKGKELFKSILRRDDDLQRGNRLKSQFNFLLYEQKRTDSSHLTLNLIVFLSFNIFLLDRDYYFDISYSIRNRFSYAAEEHRIEFNDKLKLIKPLKSSTTKKKKEFEKKNYLPGRGEVDFQL